MSKWDTWLRKLARDGKGGLGLPGKAAFRAIDRGLPFEWTMAITGDLSADAFAASLRLSPDAAGATVADFTVTVGSYAGNVTPITLELTDTETAALPSDSDFDGLEEMVVDILWTPDGGTQQRLMAGVIEVSGKVTNGG